MITEKIMWKNKLVENLFSSDPKKINTENAIQLKFDNTPRSLFKYRTFDEEGKSLNILKNDVIFLSTPNNFNDPYDCALTFAAKEISNEHALDVLLNRNQLFFKKNWNFSDDDIDQLKRSENVIYDIARLHVEKRDLTDNGTTDELDKLAQEFEKSLKDSYVDITGLKEKIHITCFSKTYQSILMWSHYANNHQGFCIEYNFTELGINHPITRFIYPVIYKDTIFDLAEYIKSSDKEFDDILFKFTEGIHKFLDGFKFPERNKNFNNMAITYAALNKFKDWSYEKEWRLVLPYRNIKKFMYIRVPKPKKIYLGAKISKKNRKKILEIGKTRNIDIYEISMKHNEFILESNLIQEN